MNCLARTGTVVSALSLVLLLSNCSGFDPTDIMDNIFAAQKKPLPGERKPLFPDGTPGVTSGVPPELIKGYQPPPATADTTPNAAEAAAAAEPPKPKPKAKPKPKVAATPPASQPRGSVAAAPAATGSVAPSSSPWPDPPPSRQSAAPPNAGQTIWPDPPAPGTVSR
jgi:hypothetical protein